MKTLMVVFERNGLFRKKEEITAHIFLNSLKGEVVIQVSDPKLREKIANLIDFSKDYIRAQGILEETAILDQIKDQLMSRKLNGTTVKDLFYLKA